jgi:hypothetical protein
MRPLRCSASSMQSKMAIGLALARYFELRYGLQRKGKNRFVPPDAPSMPNPHRVAPKQTGHGQCEIRPALQSHRRQLQRYRPCAFSASASDRLRWKPAADGGLCFYADSFFAI